MSEDLFNSGEDFDAMLKRGISLSGEDKSFFIHGRIDDLKRQLPPGFQPKNILDFGCSVGDTTKYLAEIFNTANLVGIDAAENVVDAARTKYRSSKILFETLSHMPSVPTFDLCYVNGVFHHINPNDRLGILKAIYASLIEGGYFAFFENNPWNFGTCMVMKRIPFDRNAHTISPVGAKTLLKKAGFTNIVTMRFLFYFPRPLAFLRSSEGFLVKIPLGAQYYVLSKKGVV